LITIPTAEVVPKVTVAPGATLSEVATASLAGAPPPAKLGRASRSARSRAPSGRRLVRTRRRGGPARPAPPQSSLANSLRFVNRRPHTRGARQERAHGLT
jgi:hypothetical protein